MPGSDDRSLSRRSVLKSAGALGAGALATVGTVAADSGECAETINTYTRTEGQFAGVTGAGTGNIPYTPFTAGAGLLAPYNTEPFDVEEGAFEQSDLSGKRIKVVMTWNPVDSGPNSANVFLEQQTIAGDFQVIGYGQADAGPQGANRVEFTVADGDEYNGEDASGNSVSNVALIEGGRTYRVRPQNGTGVANFEVEAKIQAFDPECVANKE